MPQTKKEPAVDASEMTMFMTTLNQLRFDKVDEIADDIEVIDADAPIKAKDLPKQLPEGLRKEIMDLSYQAEQIRTRIGLILDDLFGAADDVRREKEREIEAMKPHCKTCGQVVPAKKARRR